MIKFFRKTRYNLMETGKTGKYLKYAIGEIILVVIGILIALQINTWRNEQVNRKQEKYYLSQLKSEFESNFREAERNMQFSNSQKKNTTLLLKSLVEPLSETESKDWFFAITQLCFTPKPNYVANTWNEMIATNKLGLISNKELVENISGFYSIIVFIQKMEIESQRQNIEFRDMVNEVLDHKLRDKFFNEFVRSWKIGNDLYRIEVYPEDIPNVQPFVEKFKNINRIEGKTSDIKLDRMALYMEHEKLKENIIAIIDMLNREYEL